MPRYERVTEICALLSRSREPVSLQSLCAEMEVAPATVKRLLRFLREDLRLAVYFDRDLGGYLLLRPPDPNPMHRRNTDPPATHRARSQGTTSPDPTTLRPLSNSIGSLFDPPASPDPPQTSHPQNGNTHPTGQCATLKFAASHAAHALQRAQRHPQQTTEILDDGSVLLNVRYDDAWQIQQEVLSLGAGVEILAPTQLRQAFVQNLRAILGSYTKLA